MYTFCFLVWQPWQQWFLILKRRLHNKRGSGALKWFAFGFREFQRLQYCTTIDFWHHPIRWSKMATMAAILSEIFLLWLDFEISYLEVSLVISANMAGTHTSINPRATASQPWPVVIRQLSAEQLKPTYIKGWSIPWQKTAKTLPESEQTVQQHTNIQTQFHTFLRTFRSSYPAVPNCGVTP